MKTSGTGRVLAALLIGVIGGIYMRFRQARVLALGRQGALEAYGRSFDRMANHSSAPILAGIILAILAYGLYELIAAGFTRLIPPSEAEE
jgi:hypothetical protein